MDTATNQKLDQAWLEIYQGRGLYPKLSFGEYQALKAREMETSRNSQAKEIPLEEVLADFRRNGGEDAQLMPRTFLSHTPEDSREARIFGYHGLVTYYVTGTFIQNPNEELHLISAHIPGGPGGGGWGLNGTRQLRRMKKTLFGLRILPANIDSAIYQFRTKALVYEGYDYKLHYENYSWREDSADILRREALEFFGKK
jgi:hypothetical protein